MRDSSRGQWRVNGIKCSLPKNGADVSSQIPSAGRGREVFRWIQSVSVDHEVAIRHVHFWRLALVFAIEEFRQSSLLDLQQ